MTQGDQPPLRIGNAERTAALAALDEHLEAGRLGIDEYGERSAIAASASLASELEALFVDLPAPHPDLPHPARSPALPPTTAMPVVSASDEVSGQAAGGWGSRAVAVMPFIAVALFVVTRQWYVFLLIPAAAALVYGGGVGRGR